MPSQYTTVYEITRRIPDWSFALVGLLAIAAGGVIIWGKRRFGWPRPHWLFAIFLCLFGSLWVCVVGTTVLSSEWRAFTAYQQGDYQTVEGVVYDYRPMPYEGHQDECFSVQDQRFCYSDFDIAPGFHTAASHGGPIRSGLSVRVAYRNGHILRLDVRRDQAPTSAQSAAAIANGKRRWQLRIESDPLERNINTAFLFMAIFWTLWWNLQWKLAMRFWLKPPYGARAKVLFRIFFALSFVGAVIGFVQQLLSHPIAKQDIIPTIGISAMMCAIVAVMSASVLWMAQKRDAKAALRPPDRNGH